MNDACQSEFDVSFAFQPIVDIESQKVFAYEALVRGRSNEPAGAVFRRTRIFSASRLRPGRPDQGGRYKRHRSGLATVFSLNFLPRSLSKHCPTPSARRAPPTRPGYRTKGVSQRGYRRRKAVRILRVPAINQYGQAAYLAIDGWSRPFRQGLLADFHLDVIKIDAVDPAKHRQGLVEAIVLSIRRAVI